MPRRWVCSAGCTSDCVFQPAVWQGIMYPPQVTSLSKAMVVQHASSAGPHLRRSTSNSKTEAGTVGERSPRRKIPRLGYKMNHVQRWVVRGDFCANVFLIVLYLLGSPERAERKPRKGSRGVIQRYRLSLHRSTKHMRSTVPAAHRGVAGEPMG